jgi:hypothetical protein
MLICFILEDPLGTNNILFCRTRNQGPDIISGELMELIMHCRYPSFIMEGFINFLRFCLSKVATVGDLIGYFTGRLNNSTSEPTSFIYGPQKLLRRMIVLHP